MSDHPVRSVLLLCWRDTGHPQGGGSEAYLQRIGAQLAASGAAVTLRTARYPGAPRRGVIDGVQISRGGGPYTVYIRAGLAMVAARIGLGPLRRVRPDVVIDSQNGLPFLARLAYGRRVVLLVHHCHREQWPVAGRRLARIGWFVESRLSPRLHRRNQYVTVSLPSMRELVDLGVSPDRIAVVRNGVDEPPVSGPAVPRSATPRVVVLSRLVPHKQIEDALAAVAALRPSYPELQLDVVGGGWWRDRLMCVEGRFHFRGNIHVILVRHFALSFNNSHTWLCPMLGLMVFSWCTVRWAAAMEKLRASLSGIPLK